MTKRKAYSYIRMSTDIQLKGDSLRRQLASSKAYAETHNLELVESIDGMRFEDIGVSAFKGKNTQKGALSVFLSQLDNGKIAPNSVLLVESLDRLSRDKLASALNQFMLILESGVEIITLSDSQKYTKEIINQNPAALFIGLSIMFRANEESEMKSKRLSAAWKNKRDKASTKVVTKTCPAWLKLSDKTGKFLIIKDRGQVVKKIFDMCINTCGLYSIAKHLNESKTPVFGDGKMWHLSYIKKIIINRSVLGEFQPHQIIGGKREKYGEPIANYFPKLIDEQTFLLAQVAIAKRSSTGKGRKGTNFANLFASITYCGSCGAKMFVKSRGGKSRSNRYLVCSNKNVAAGCQMKDWNLADFEEKMLRHLREVNFEELIDNHNQEKKVSLGDQIEALREKLRSNEEAIAEALTYAVNAKFSKELKQRFEAKIGQLDADSTQTKAEIEELLKQRAEEEESQHLLHADGLKEFLEKVDAHKTDYLFRSSLNQYLTKMIDKLVLQESAYPYGSKTYEETDEVVKAFRKVFKSRKKLTLDELVVNEEFKQFHEQFFRVIKIQYRSGDKRYLFFGSDSSVGINKKTKEKSLVKY